MKKKMSGVAIANAAAKMASGKNPGELPKEAKKIKTGPIEIGPDEFKNPKKAKK